MNNSGYITHIVQVGDSLQKIASVYGISDWRDLAYANNLDYPYIHDSLNGGAETEGNVLKVGDKMLIPSTEYSSHTNNLRVNTVENRAYGCDLDLYYHEGKEGTKNLEVKGELSDNSGDLRLSEGVRNLHQRLLIGLSTAKGSMILHPNFGSDINKYVGLKGTPQNLIKLQLSIRESILSDELVEEVKDLIVEANNGIVSIDCNIVPIPPHAPFKFKESINTLQ